MDNTEFFDSVLPDTGYYCSVGITNGAVRQSFVESKADIVTRSNKLSSDGADVYYALASFSTPTKRTGVNVAYLKCLWLDIDCGAGKPYASQPEGLSAVKTFVKTTGLPRPTVINSGRGWHVYWPLEEPISVDEWKPLAEGLKALCIDHNLAADAVVTADTARILRVPNTLNFKGEPPLKVEVSVVGDASSIDRLKSVIPVKTQRVPTPSASKLVSTSDSQSSFPMIVRKSVKGKGCAQIANIISNQEGLEEPLWRGGLSIAIRCVDGEAMVHKMSSKDPRYDRAEAINKANNTVGPYTCKEFRNLNPEACNGCEQDITSPIQLGREFARAPKPSELTRPDKDSGLFHLEINKPTTPTSSKSSPQLTMADIPFPYFKGASGGVYKESKDEDGEKVEVMVYEHDLYITRRVFDPLDGETVLMKHLLPHDGARDFVVPLKIVQSPKEFKDVLSTYGVAASQKQMGNIMAYTTTFVKELQRKRKADKAKTHFGWNDDRTEFLIGERNFTPKGEEFSPPSSVTRDICKSLAEVGDIDIWTEGIQDYMDSDAEKQFAVLCGFAAPLMVFTGLDGMNVNFSSNRSGTGKSLALAVQNSIWGHYKELMLAERDTDNSRQLIMGIMHSLPACLDETTNMVAAVLSDFLFCTSQGRGKNRMEGQRNALRENHTRWATILSTSSNSSPKDKLAALKSRPDGELARLIEVTMTQKFTDAKGRDLYTMIGSNYGTAGPIYAEWLVKKQKDIPDMISQAIHEIESEVTYEGSERYWVGLAALILVSAKLVKDSVGLESDIPALKLWVINMVRQARGSIKEHIVDYESVLGEFLISNVDDTMIINNYTPDPITHSIIVKEARRSVVVRREPENELLFITRKSLREYCAENQISMDEMLAGDIGLKFKGGFKKRMTSGTGLISTPIDALMFSTEGVDMDDYIGPSHAP